MSYIKAENVLPQELIETIRQYVDGKLIYIPCREKQQWGTTTSAKAFFCERNERIYATMKIELRPVDDSNRSDCIKLKVSESQSEYIASNESSLEAAKEHADVARPFVIYADGVAVGFTMFAFEPDYEDPDDRYWLWRFMIDEKLQGQGYGKEALKQIIAYFKENGATNIRLSTKESNVNAIHLYRSFGFVPNGDVNDGETVFELNW